VLTEDAILTPPLGAFTGLCPPSAGIVAIDRADADWIIGRRPSSTCARRISPDRPGAASDGQDGAASARPLGRSAAWPLGRCSAAATAPASVAARAANKRLTVDDRRAEPQDRNPGLQGQKDDCGARSRAGARLRMRRFAGGHSCKSASLAAGKRRGANHPCRTPFERAWCKDLPDSRASP